MLLQLLLLKVMLLSCEDAWNQRWSPNHGR
jgi:hypothetical protein